MREPKDQRNLGLKRIYWFYDKERDEHFPVDGELQGWHIFIRKDFKTKFDFIGWSDGQTFNQEMAKMKKMSKREYIEMAKQTIGEGDALHGSAAMDEEEVHEMYEDKRLAYKVAFEKELQAARDNPDKTPPRDFRVRDLSGNPQTSGMIPEFLKTMR